MITPNFTTSQSLNSLDVGTLTDTSTGSDVTLTTRRVYFQKHDGTYLVPVGTTTNYIIWSYSNSSIDIHNLLDKDYSLNVLVQWYAGGILVTSKTLLQRFKGYSVSFLIDLTRFNASNPSLLNNKNYYESKNKLRGLVEDAEEATLYGDQTKSQLCFKLAKQLTDNQVFFY